jgi:hypothetical protein
MAKLRKLMPKKDFHPLPVVPGVGALAITAFNYRDTDIRPYNEISIAVLMSYKNVPVVPIAGIAESLLRNEFHAYIHHLPVTTEIALEGGVKIYNLPKFLAEIVYEDRDDHVYVELREDGKLILSLKGKKLKTGGERKFKFVIYPVKEDRAQTANCVFRAEEFAMSFMPNCVEIELGKEHPIGRELDGLILLKKAFFYMYVPNFQAILYGPTVLE